MILSARTFVLLGIVGTMHVAAFVAPVLGWVGLGFDAVVLALAVLDARLAARSAPTVVRTLERTLHQGEPARVVLAAGNQSRRAVRVRLRECLAEELISEPLDFDVSIPPRSVRELEYGVVPRWRGDAELKPTALRVLGPLGLSWRGLEAAADSGSVAAVRIFPRIRFGGATSLVLRQAMERRVGSNALMARGISAETYALREYLPGDEYRKIHWKQSARQRKPIVRETSWEQHQQMIVMLDCGRPMASVAGVHSKLDHALAAVLALMRVAVAQRDDVTLVLFSKEIEGVVRIDRRRSSFQPVFERVYRQAAGFDEPDYVGAAQWCSRKVQRRSLAILVTSVLDLALADQVGRALASLALRHKPLLVNLEDPGLMECDRSVPRDERQSYAKVSAMAIVEANHALSLKLRSRGVDVVTSSASSLTLAVVQRYLDLKARMAY